MIVSCECVERRSESSCLCRHISSNTVLCCVCIWVRISGWYAILFLFFSPHHLVTELLSFCTQRWCRTVSLCLSVFVLHLIMHYDSPPLACPVLFCSAPRLFPFHWWCPCFPPLTLCCGILLIFLSLAGQEQHRQRREEERGAGMSKSVFCWYSWAIPADFLFCFVFSWTFFGGVLVKDGRAWTQTQR